MERSPIVSGFLLFETKTAPRGAIFVWSERPERRAQAFFVRRSADFFMSMSCADDASSSLAT